MAIMTRKQLEIWFVRNINEDAFTDLWEEQFNIFVKGYRLRVSQCIFCQAEKPQRKEKVVRRNCVPQKDRRTRKS